MTRLTWVTRHTRQTRLGGVRTVKHAKLPISSFDEPVSEPVTIISARDASASENKEKHKILEIKSHKYPEIIC